MRNGKVRLKQNVARATCRMCGASWVYVDWAKVWPMAGRGKPSVSYQAHTTLRKHVRQNHGGREAD